MRRTFIVGCPRSGTTLVQALLARHPAVLTLPETAFFEYLHGSLEWRWGDRGAKPRKIRLRHRLGFAHKRARMKLAALRRSLPSSVHAGPISRRVTGCVCQFITMLDGCADAAGCSMWVEKTPYHLLYVPEIEHQVPEARFVHVIRAGEDVLASVADANMRFDRNNAFGGGTIHWARRWNHAVKMHLAYKNRPRHHFIFLEDLIADRNGEWHRLCTFLDLDSNAELDRSCAQIVTDLDSEPWKQDAVSGVPQPSLRKAEQVFGPQVRQWLQDKLLPYDELRRCLGAKDIAKTARDASQRSCR
ncbi:sulfotransferase [Rhodanobacter sp. L36]|uniref:sulfotransferase family protein n=1 Tax=Rhodanobacter sp. L36 TaxID=1747221 RepID=UPI00131E36F7|nr:sulfotransferase [Rhodanobacter sp. L36]